MNRLHRWLFVSQATHKAALLCLSAVLVTALALAAAAPARAQNCPYVTGGRLAFCMDNGRVDLGQQVTAHVGQNVFLCLHVNLSDGSVANVTQNGNTSYSVGTGTGYIRHFELVELYVPPAADANKQFPLYAIYHDACKNVNWTFTVSLHVIP